MLIKMRSVEFISKDAENFIATGKGYVTKVKSKGNIKMSYLINKYQVLHQGIG